jgi:hypothetical protein
MPLWVISCSKLLLWGDDLLLRPDVDEQLQLREEKLLIVESGQLQTMIFTSVPSIPDRQGLLAPRR